MLGQIARLLSVAFLSASILLDREVLREAIAEGMDQAIKELGLSNRIEDLTQNLDRLTDKLSQTTFPN